MNTAPLEQFRSDTREWLQANCPEAMRTPARNEAEQTWGGRKGDWPSEDARLWLERMGERGWTVPTWPGEYGGGGLDREHNAVLQEELARIKARLPLASFGIWMLGPVLLEFGTEEQKRQHLPKIAKGEIRWCQGYSEPGAGSDLASLQTRAEDQGEHYLVNGQKIWTSNADKSDWIFCLVRTGPSEPKHEGISFLLIDMESKGVSTRPIQLISGASPFCETFFENVQVPVENLVGGLNKGWTVAKRLLQHERRMISGFGLMGSSSEAPGGPMPLYDLARHYQSESEGPIGNEVLRDRIAWHEMRGHAFALTLRRAAGEARSEGPGHTSAMLKYYGTEHNKRRHELMMAAMGTQGLGWEGEGFAADELRTTRAWLRSKGNSIEGGTSEIQLNIIAKRVLGLPD